MLRVSMRRNRRRTIGQNRTTNRNPSRRDSISMSVSEEKLRGQLVDCTRMMVMAELLDYSGHVSARLPSTDRFLIPARDSSRAGIKADDILIVDLNGKVLEGEGPCPAETQIHAGVYRARDDVQVVGHGHPPMSTLFTMVDRPMVAVRNYGYRFIGTPVHPDPTHIRTARRRRGPHARQMQLLSAARPWQRRCRQQRRRGFPRQPGNGGERPQHRLRREPRNDQADHAAGSRTPQGKLRQERLPRR